jgi:putative transposase
MANRKPREKDEIDQLLDNFDLHGMTQDEIAGPNELAKQLTSRLYERALEAEMDEHPGYEKNSNAGDHSGNSRNGYTGKTVIDGKIMNTSWKYRATGTVPLSR